MNSQYYLIHRVTLELEAATPASARRLQGEAAHLFRHWILPQMEALLDRLVPRDVVLRIDTLNVDLPRIDAAAFAREFGATLLGGIAAQVTRFVATTDDKPPTAAADQPARAMSHEESLFTAWLHFLTTGQLPGWRAGSWDALEEEAIAMAISLIGPTTAAPRLLALLATEEVARDRLLLQFSPLFVRRLLLPLREQAGIEAGGESTSDPSRQQPLATDQPLALPIGSSRQRLQAFIRQLASDEAGDRSEPGQCARLPTAEGAGSVPPLPVRQERSQTTTAAAQLGRDNDHRAAAADEHEHGLHLVHAGLVLLHPFLESFFRECALLNTTGFIDRPAQTLAIHLLQYLATGQENPPEYLLSCEKYLCGAELTAPVPRYLPLSEPMQAEGERLLRAVIDHWRALKNTSPAGLRASFLQRAGKLQFDGFHHRLIVETKSYDLLLNRLPWGIGLIHLPWLQRPIAVDWQP